MDICTSMRAGSRLRGTAACCRQSHSCPVATSRRQQQVLQRMLPRQQAASTQAVTKEVQSAAPAAPWSPWTVLNPFRQKQKVDALVTVSEEELWEMLAADQQVPLVVFFSAPWCGPCKIMVQRLENVMQTLGPQGVKAVKIDTDASPELATALKVYKLPTMFFVGPSSEKPAAQITGLLPETVLRDMVQNKSQFLGTDIRKAVHW